MVNDHTFYLTLLKGIEVTFVKKEKILIDYLMLYNGKALAEQLGVYGYPTVVICGGTGKVIYSESAFNDDQIDQFLKLNLDAAISN